MPRGRAQKAAMEQHRQEFVAWHTAVTKLVLQQVPGVTKQTAAAFASALLRNKLTTDRFAIRVVRPPTEGGDDEQ